MKPAQTATAARLSRLRAGFAAREIDGILISESSNRRYLSGFVGTAGYLVISNGSAVLATDSRYVEQAGRQAPDFRVERIKAGLDWLPRLAGELGISKLGFEADHITVTQHGRVRDALKEAPGAGKLSLVPTSGLTLELRAIKDASEMALLQRAIDIGDEAFDEVSAQIVAGMTEAEVAWKIEMAIRERGAESISFDTIVGAGPNSALPHHRADDTVIRAGQPVVIDMGARYQGYCSDLTRTIVVGNPDAQFKRVYDTVLAAQLTAIEAVVAKMSGADCDKLARSVIEEAGHGDAFGHSLGHGVGLEIHESPGVGPNSKGLLLDGMVFTIEPGIYLPGWGGVRIEDVVVLERGKARVLSHARKHSP